MNHLLNNQTLDSNDTVYNSIRKSKEGLAEVQCYNTLNKIYKLHVKHIVQKDGLNQL